MELKKQFNDIIREMAKEVGGLKTAEDKKQFCKKYGIDAAALTEITSRYSEWAGASKTDEGVWNAWRKSSGTVDYSTDIEKSKASVNNAYYRFRAGITNIALKRFEEEINPEKIEDLAELRKEDEYDGLSQDLREKMYKIGMLKYASSLTPDKINEKVLNSLYVSGFKGEIADPTVNLVYKMYVQGKEKDRAIADLQGRVKQQDELIRYDANLISQLYGKTKKLQQCLQKSRQIVSNLVKSIRGIDESLQNSQKYAEQDNKKGFFSRVGDRLKSIFSKPVPQLNSGNFVQAARDNCRIADETATKDIQQTRDDGLGQVEQGIMQRNNLQRSVYSKEIPSVPITEFSLDEVVARGTAKPVRSEAKKEAKKEPGKLVFSTGETKKPKESKGFEEARDF